MGSVGGVGTSAFGPYPASSVMTSGARAGGRGAAAMKETKEQAACNNQRNGPTLRIGPSNDPTLTMGTKEGSAEGLVAPFGPPWSAPPPSIQYGVPTIVLHPWLSFARSGSSFELPKSASFTVPSSPTRMLSPLMSPSAPLSRPWGWGWGRGPAAVDDTVGVEVLQAGGAKDADGGIAEWVVFKFECAWPPYFLRDIW